MDEFVYASAAAAFAYLSTHTHFKLASNFFLTHYDNYLHYQNNIVIIIIMISEIDTWIELDRKKKIIIKLK